MPQICHSFKHVQCMLLREDLSAQEFTACLEKLVANSVNPKVVKNTLVAQLYAEFRNLPKPEAEMERDMIQEFWQVHGNVLSVAADKTDGFSAVCCDDF